MLELTERKFLTAKVLHQLRQWRITQWVKRNIFLPASLVGTVETVLDEAIRDQDLETINELLTQHPDLMTPSIIAHTIVRNLGKGLTPTTNLALMPLMQGPFDATARTILAGGAQAAFEPYDAAARKMFQGASVHPNKPLLLEYKKRNHSPPPYGSVI